MPFPLPDPLAPSDARALARGLGAARRGIALTYLAYGLLFPGSVLCAWLAPWWWLGPALSGTSFLAGAVTAFHALGRLRRVPVSPMWRRHLGFSRVCAFLPLASAAAALDENRIRGTFWALTGGVVGLSAAFLGAAMAGHELARRLRSSPLIGRAEDTRRSVVVTSAVGIGATVMVALPASALAETSHAAVGLVLAAVLYVVAILPFILARLNGLFGDLRWEAARRAGPATPSGGGPPVGATP